MKGGEETDRLEEKGCLEGEFGIGHGLPHDAAGQHDLPVFTKTLSDFERCIVREKQTSSPDKELRRAFISPARTTQVQESYSRGCLAFDRGRDPIVQDGVVEADQPRRIQSSARSVISATTSSGTAEGSGLISDCLLVFFCTIGLRSMLRILA